MAARLSAAERRRQVLQHALGVFAEQGFHSTSMNDVAEAAGVTKPVVYQHFTSKRVLYRALLVEVGQQLRELIVKATANATSPHQQVEQGMTAYLSWVAADSAGFRLLFGGGARRDEEFARDVRAVEASIAEAIAELITADVEAEHRLVLAHGILGLAEGSLRHLVGANRPIDTEVLARQLADLAWAGLRGIRRV
ncbi:MAG: putative TetR family transcriptional regulator [Acidimicrobiia bacterium]|nr:putative TetR family transcriptional regulator [Acidimicrobiia bacterium]